MRIPYLIQHVLSTWPPCYHRIAWASHHLSGGRHVLPLYRQTPCCITNTIILICEHQVMDNTPEFLRFHRSPGRGAVHEARQYMKVTTHADAPGLTAITVRKDGQGRPTCPPGASLFLETSPRSPVLHLASRSRFTYHRHSYISINSLTLRSQPWAYVQHLNSPSYKTPTLPRLLTSGILFSI